MKWGNPDILPWLFLWIPLAWAVFKLIRRRESRLARLITRSVWNSIVPAYVPGRGRRRAWLWLFAIAVAAVALARPQWGFHWEEVRRRGLDIVVVLDTSRSMLAPDFRPNRLQHAKWGIRDFIQQLKADRVGLVLFSGSAFLQCPLTIDYAAFLMLLDDAHCGIIPRGGTAIEQGLRAAIRAFRDHGDSDRVILLVSDGEDHEGNPLRLIDELKQKKIRVYAIGIGTPEGELLPAPQDQGGTFLKDREGKVVKSALNEAILEQLAIETGGMYVRATPSDFGAHRIYEQNLANLKREEQESQLLKVYEERFPWFVALSLLLLAVEAAIPGRRNANHTTNEKAALGRVLVVLLFLLAPNAFATEREAREAMREGLRHYAATNYETAAQAFSKAAELAANTSLDPALARYNEATALLEMGQLDQSSAKFQDALRSSDLSVQQRAWYNYGLSLYKMAEQAAAQTDMQIAEAAIEQSLSAYRNALLLDSRDLASKINYELALKLKEQIELQKQQQEQQQQPNQQSKEQPPQQDPTQDQQQERSSSEQQKDQQQPSDPQKQDEQQPPPQEKAQQSGQQDVKPEEMTREEVERILNAMRQEENRYRAQYRVLQAQPVPVEKDW